MASHEQATEERGTSPWSVLAVMVAILVIGIGAVALFGYPALIVLALVGTAAMLVTLVVMTAGR
ncbi:hypothetical protein CXZ10_15425 [Pleomorphomonas diazotrophica]|uniref:Uncharacterized protein n=1 Tax=Pleomorphomonas diazotrophica TaxID=1166257 RepID=A0A1I4W270_9HYPH|nr:hypothetical protein [Pleomorphomonas diazotrophica]PKR88190.1 hypothetical protein CXZ10_15425 [Pleomorphomonas diazotrophica]SFN07601.1 hypothetical protein SAMN05192571_114113 [Pleomorphomonas diazotrophica]